MDASGPKRRKLNYDKCAFCRKDKKRCDPPNRQWPQKCDRCVSMGLDCSENENLKTTKLSSETADGGLSWNSGNGGNHESQMLNDFQELYDSAVKAHLHLLSEHREFELACLCRYEDYLARTQLINKAENFTPTDIITHLKDRAKDRKNEISDEVSKFLKCPFPLVRQAALSVIARLTTRRPADYAAEQAIGSEDTLNALLESLRSSDRIDIEVSVRECLLRAMFVRNAHRQDMVDSLRAYSEACERYMLRVQRLSSVQSEMMDYDESILPCSGDAQMLGLLMQYCPDILFRRRDTYWNNAMAAAILSAEQKDIEKLLQNMEDAIFSKLVTPISNYECTMLHTAAIRGMICVFDKLSALDLGEIKSATDVIDWDYMTPLSHAAANGSSTIVGTLLELGADPDLEDNRRCVALHYAARNGNEDTVRQLLLRNPGLCTRPNRDAQTPVTLAIRHGHHRVTKLFFSQPCRGLLEDGEEINADIWMRLLELAFWHDYPQVVDLLCFDQFVGQIDQTGSRQGQTFLSLAAEAGNLDAVKFLLSRGADVSIADQNGETPCDCARRNGYHTVVSVLEESSSLAVGQ